jgi:hypothetical protein
MKKIEKTKIVPTQSMLSRRENQNHQKDQEKFSNLVVDITTENSVDPSKGDRKESKNSKRVIKADIDRFVCFSFAFYILGLF